MSTSPECKKNSNESEYDKHGPPKWAKKLQSSTKDYITLKFSALLKVSSLCTWFGKVKKFQIFTRKKEKPSPTVIYAIWKWAKKLQWNEVPLFLFSENGKISECVRLNMLNILVNICIFTAMESYLVYSKEFKFEERYI